VQWMTYLQSAGYLQVDLHVNESDLMHFSSLYGGGGGHCSSPEHRQSVWDSFFLHLCEGGGLFSWPS